MMPNHKAQKEDGNSYVPDMTFHHHIDINGVTTVRWIDSPVDGTNVNPLMTVASDTNYDIDLEVPGEYGRSLRIVSTNAGDITIVGFDYLGQVMTETITLIVGTANGAKAFSRITEIKSDDVDGDITINVGSLYGLPFCASEIIRETVNGAATTEGALVTPDTNTPTATTGDVRGTYNPSTGGNSSNDIQLTYATNNQLTGGLYGQVQA